jgi:hypothetical protein
VAGRSDGVAPGACAWPAFSPPGTTGRSRRIDLLAHDPCVLTHLPAAGEAVSLEQLNGRTEQETAVSLTARYHFRDCLDAATAGLGDLVERAFKRSAGDPLPAMLLIQRADRVRIRSPFDPRPGQAGDLEPVEQAKSCQHGTTAFGRSASCLSRARRLDPSGTLARAARASPAGNAHARRHSDDPEGALPPERSSRRRRTRQLRSCHRGA